MPSEDDARKFIARMPNEELKRICEEEQIDYAKEEVALIGEELKRRGYQTGEEATSAPSPSSVIHNPPKQQGQYTVNRTYLIAGTICAVVIIVLLLVLGRSTEPPPFSYKVTKATTDTAATYIVKIMTDPGVVVEYSGERYPTDQTGQTTLFLPSNNLSFSLNTVQLALIDGDKRTTQDIQLDNRPTLFSFDSPVTNFQPAQDGKWIFQVAFRTSPEYSITVDGNPLSKLISGVYVMYFDVSDVDPLANQMLLHRFYLLVKGAGNSLWQGYVDLTFQFPKLNINVQFKGNSVTRLDANQVSFKGSSITAYGRVSPRIFVEGLLIGDKPVVLQPDGSFECRLTGLVTGSNEIPFVVQGKKGTPITETISIVREVTNAEKVAEYRRRSSKLTYAMLSKNPDRYKGESVVYLGKIFNIQESGSETSMQVNVTHKGYGFWDDQIMVYYASQTDFVKDNLVWVCGTVRGSFTYQSVAGWNITVPLVDAEYLGTYEPEY